jgi:peptidoglycan/LPS O-acetylase OafA/YrhL
MITQTPIETAQDREETLGEFLAERARRLSDTYLAGHAITAVLAAVAIAAWRGPLWDIRLSIAVCLLGFGIWGVADRDLAQRESASRSALWALRSARLVAAVCGFAAGAYLMMSLLGRALGRIIR